MTFLRKYTTDSSLFKNMRKSWQEMEKNKADGLLKRKVSLKKNSNQTKKEKMENKKFIKLIDNRCAIMMWIDATDHWLYFLTKATYSLNEMRPELSISILLKFHCTISSVIGIFKGLNVSSISLLNSLMSISSSSSPYLAGFFAFCARSPKKCANLFTTCVRIHQKWFFHRGLGRCDWNASRAGLGWCPRQAHPDCRPRVPLVRWVKEWSSGLYRKPGKWAWISHKWWFWDREWAAASGYVGL